LTGYSPYPAKTDDERLPHIQAKIGRQIQKTALGAQDSVEWDYQADLITLIESFKSDGFIMLALEQSPRAVELQDYESSGDIVLIVGNEVEGIENEILSVCDEVVVIPMAGKKESYNVAVAAGMALFHLKFGN
jgi:23S rRNA (guanosine2251-2'-O)-methyltransferase